MQEIALIHVKQGDLTLTEKVLLQFLLPPLFTSKLNKAIKVLGSIQIKRFHPPFYMHQFHYILRDVQIESMYHSQFSND